jgi:Cu/Ag efflux protein CusF
MTAFFMRPTGLALSFLSLAACTNPLSAETAPSTPVLGVDLGSFGPVTGHGGGSAPSTQHHGAAQMAHGGHNDAHGVGTINSVDPAQHKLNISHGPIPAIGFPAMTMDFAVAHGVDLGALKPGMRVDFTIEQGAGGTFEIQSVSPAGGRQ